jgi:tripartite-type tricarboxylate transporter receptor subunit TctC
MTFHVTRRGVAGAAIAALAGGAAQAQTPAQSQPQNQADAAWPARPVRMIVPMAPGGSTDVMGRLIARALQDVLKQSFVIENRSGAGSLIGTEAAMNAPADGYTLLVNGMPHTIVPAVAPRAPYDPVRNFTPISTLGVAAMVMFVNKDMPARSAREFVELSREKPDRFSFATSGSGSLTQLMVDMLQVRAGIKLVSVPYRGAGPGMADLASGVVQASFNTLPTAAPLVAAGQVRALAVASEERLPNMPDVPTFKEQGIDLVVEHWWGVLGPANMPASVVARLNAAIKQAVNSPEMAVRFEEIAVIPRASTPAGFTEVLEEDVARWTGVLRPADAPKP